MLIRLIQHAGRGELSARLRLAGACALAGVLSFTPTGYANGSKELFGQVAFDPLRPDRLMVLYTNGGSRRGLLFSEDAGASWKMLCAAGVTKQVLADGTARDEEARTWLANERRIGPIAVAAGGATLVASSEGLFVGDARGCGFRGERPFARELINALVPHPSQPEIVFALVAYAGEEHGIWRRDAAGSWTRFGAVEPADTEAERRVLDGLLIAKRDTGLRAYELLRRHYMDGRPSTVAVRVSDDEGQTWREHALPTELQNLELVAVDPSDPQRLLAVIRRLSNQTSWEQNRDTILLSRDGGAHFENYFEVAGLGAAVFRNDGTLWIADSGAVVEEDKFRAGLFRAPPGLASPPQQLSSDAHECLTYVPARDRMYACQTLRLGVLDPASGALEELVKIDAVDDFVSCSGRDVAADCEAQLCDGYCHVVHYPAAPVCRAYDKPACGPRAAERYFDAGDAAAQEAGVVASDSGESLPDADAEPLHDAAAPGHVVDPDDGYDAGVIAIDAGPVAQQSSVGCQCHAGSTRGRSAHAALWSLGALALWLRRGRVRSRQAVEE
jgi:hypothetical protein